MANKAKEMCELSKSFVPGFEEYKRLLDDIKTCAQMGDRFLLLEEMKDNPHTDNGKPTVFTPLSVHLLLTPGVVELLEKDGFKVTLTCRKVSVPCWDKRSKKVESYVGFWIFKKKIEKIIYERSPGFEELVLREFLIEWCCDESNP